MKCRMSVLSGVVVLLSMFVIVSCNQGPVSNSEVVQPVQNSGVIAELGFGDGGKIMFEETEPGCLVTTGTANTMEAFAPYKDLDPVELYEAVSGSEAPASLIAANQRAVAAAKTESDVLPPPDLKENVEPPKDDNSVKMAKAMMSGSTFSSTYCSDCLSYDFSSCMTYRTGDHSYTKNCSLIRNYIHPYRGRVRFQAQYWNGSSYVTVRDYIVLEGSVYYYAVAGAKKYRRMVVCEASGDGLHYVHKGNYNL